MIYFVRHGETEWNRAGRLQGRADSPLTPLGVRLALAYGARLADELRGVDALQLHASPLGRARRTAALLAEALAGAGHPLRFDPLLAEHDVGAWTGLTWAEIERTSGATAETLRDWHFRPPDGETRAEMAARAARWLAARSDGAIHIVVSHGGMSRAFRAAYLGLDAGTAAQLPTHVHGRIFRLAGGTIDELVVEAHAAPDERLIG